MRKLRLILISLFCLNLVCIISVHPSFSKPYKDKKVTSTKPRILPKIIINSNEPKTSPTASENPLSKFAADHPDIAQAIIMAKKYKGTQPVEKSQLETQSQYEARFAASQPTNLSPIEIIVPPKEIYKYDADEGNFIVSMKQESRGNTYDFKTLRNELVFIDTREKNVTCTNGLGAKFHYTNTTNHLDIYSINYSEKDAFKNGRDPSWGDFSWAVPGSKTLLPARLTVSQTPPPPVPIQQPLVPNPRITVDRISNPEPSNPIKRLSDKYSNYAYGSFDFKLPMSVSDVRGYVTSDEKNLNGKLKFLVTIKPVFPFYSESTHYSGDTCGDRYNNSGSTYVSYGDRYHAIFDIVSLKLIDSSNNKILLERKYSQ